MSKNGSAGTDPGENGTGDAGKEENPQVSSVTPVLNFVSRRQQARSKRCGELTHLCDTVRGLLASGRIVNERDLFEISPNYRYLRGDCLKSLRIVSRLYPTRTRLYLDGGLWHLQPISQKQNPPLNKRKTPKKFVPGLDPVIIPTYGRE